MRKKIIKGDVFLRGFQKTVLNPQFLNILSKTSKQIQTLISDITFMNNTVTRKINLTKRPDQQSKEVWAAQ